MARGNKIACLYPLGRKGKHWVYLVGGKDGLLKVGRTGTPRDRIMTHRRAFGDNFAWCHLFAPLTANQAGGVEFALKREFARLGRRIGWTETFYGIEKQQAFSAVREAIAWRVANDADMAEARLRNQYADQAWEAFKAKVPELCGEGA